MSPTIKINSKLSDLHEIGPLLKTIREMKGMTVGFISSSTGLNWSSVNNFEVSPSSISAIQRISKVLKVDFEVTITDETNSSSKISLDDLKSIVTQSVDLSNITQAELSRRSGISNQGITNFKNVENPSVRIIQALIGALGYKLSINLLVSDLDLDSPQIQEIESELATSIKTEPDFAESIGARLAEERKLKGLTKAELSRLSGVPAQSVTIVEERGRGFNNFYKVAEALNFKLEVFIKDGNKFIETNIKDIPKVLTSIRESRGITPYKFSKMSGLTYRSVSIFSNSSNSPASSVERYAKALNVKICFMLTKGTVSAENLNG